MGNHYYMREFPLVVMVPIYGREPYLVSTRTLSTIVDTSNPSPYEGGLLWEVRKGVRFSS